MKGSVGAQGEKSPHGAEGKKAEQAETLCP